MPFRELVRTDAELRKLREEYATQPAKQRRMAAHGHTTIAHASMLMGNALKESDWVDPTWHDSAAPLAIDPELLQPSSQSVRWSISTAVSTRRCCCS